MRALRVCSGVRGVMAHGSGLRVLTLLNNIVMESAYNRKMIGI